MVLMGLFLTGCTQHQQLPLPDLKRELMGDLTATSKTMEVDGRRMHWLEAGEGRPVVLLHGWTCSGYFWKPILPLLQNHCRVLAPDLPGHGLSGKKEDSYLPREQADRILAWLSAIGVESFFLVGHSMGGEISVRMAHGAADRVEGMVLISAIGLTDNPGMIPWYCKLANTSLFRRPSTWFFSEPMLRVSANLCMTGPDHTPDPVCVRDVVLSNTNTREDTNALLLTTRDGLFCEFVDDKLDAMSLPVLCVWGDADLVVPKALGEQYAAALPNAELLVVEGSGHMVPWEAPDVVSGAILSAMEKGGEPALPRK